MFVRKRLKLQPFPFALPICTLIAGLCNDASGQSVWQKMKQNVLQQQCQQGIQKACQALAQMNQKQPQSPQSTQQQPSQLGQQAAGRGNQQAGRDRDDGGPVHPPSGTKVEETILAPLSNGAKFFISPHGEAAA